MGPRSNYKLYRHLTGRGRSLPGGGMGWTYATSFSVSDKRARDVDEAIDYLLRQQRFRNKSYLVVEAILRLAKELGYARPTE